MAKFAIMVNAAPDKAHTSTAANALEYGLDLSKKDHEVEIYFDGSATRWPGKVERNHDHPVYKYYEEVRERDLIGGACEYCAGAYDATEGLREAGIELLGGASFNHGPNVGDLYEDGYELITMG